MTGKLETYAKQARIIHFDIDPCESFFDVNVDMEALENLDFKVLKRQVLESASDAEAIGCIETFLCQQLAKYYDKV